MLGCPMIYYVRKGAKWVRIMVKGPIDEAQKKIGETCCALCNTFRNYDTAVVESALELCVVLLCTVSRCFTKIRQADTVVGRHITQAKQRKVPTCSRCFPSSSSSDRLCPPLCTMLSPEWKPSAGKEATGCRARCSHSRKKGRMLPRQSLTADGEAVPDLAGQPISRETFDASFRSRDVQAGTCQPACVLAPRNREGQKQRRQMVQARQAQEPLGQRGVERGLVGPLTSVEAARRSRKGSQPDSSW